MLQRHGGYRRAAPQPTLRFNFTIRHSRTGIQANPKLAPRFKHSGVTMLTPKSFLTADIALSSLIWSQILRLTACLGIHYSPAQREQEE
jgi:hypothetical protein